MDSIYLDLLLGFGFYSQSENLLIGRFNSFTFVVTVDISGLISVVSLCFFYFLSFLVVYLFSDSF